MVEMSITNNGIEYKFSITKETEDVPFPWWVNGHFTSQFATYHDCLEAIMVWAEETCGD